VSAREACNGIEIRCLARSLASSSVTSRWYFELKLGDMLLSVWMYSLAKYTMLLAYQVLSYFSLRHVYFEIGDCDCNQEFITHESKYIVQVSGHRRNFKGRSQNFLLKIFFHWLFQPIQGPGLLFSSVIIFHRR
jgi:hypothetical protein